MNANRIRALLTASVLAFAPVFTVACAPEPPVGDGMTENDNDGDGTLNAADKCVDVAGPVDNFGCPKQPEKPTTSDRDGDGIGDKVDDCPDQFGIAQYKGCPAPMSGGMTPDRDGDGIIDAADVCPDVKGIAQYNGCPAPQTPNKTDAECAAIDLHWPNACGPKCVSFAQDSLNCGACGNACGAGRVCENYVCKTSGGAPNTGAWARLKTGGSVSWKVGWTLMGDATRRENTVTMTTAKWGDSSYTGVYGSPGNVAQTLQWCIDNVVCTGRRMVDFAPFRLANGAIGTGDCECPMDGPGNL